ncbi:MAG: Pr6Pr family membrane protein [Microbacteriaceae bacterium]
MRWIRGIGRLLLAGVGVVALVGNFQYVLGFASFVTSNFMSYFTVQSAIAGVMMFVLGAIAAFRGAAPRWFGAVRALVTSYMIVSGIVFAAMVIQASTLDYTIAVPWSDQLLHFWIPGFAVIDWLLDPGTVRPSGKLLGLALVYPSLWGVFTLIRGSMVGWYPYFFLDRNQVSLAESIAYCALCLAIVTGIVALLTMTSHFTMTSHLRRRRVGGFAVRRSRRRRR